MKNILLFTAFCLTLISVMVVCQPHPVRYGSRESLPARLPGTTAITITQGDTVIVDSDSIRVVLTPNKPPYIISLTHKWKGVSYE